MQPHLLGSALKSCIMWKNVSYIIETIAATLPLSIPPLHQALDSSDGCFSCRAPTHWSNIRILSESLKATATLFRTELEEQLY